MQGAIEDRRRGSRRKNRRGRRRYPRVRLGIAGFYESSERVLMPSGGNLTLRGAFLRTAVPDSPGTRATLRLELQGSVAMLKIPARVVWSNEEPGMGPVGMGLRFDGLLPWQLKRVAATLLRSAGFETLIGL